MSITHNLTFESQRTREEVLKSLLSSNIGLQQARYGEVQAEGLFGSVVELSRSYQMDFLEEYGFKPKLVLSFDETFEGDRDETLKILGNAFALVLTKEQSNAILSWVIDTPILERRSNTIKVTSEPEFDWLREALDKANLSYEVLPTQAIGQSAM